MESSNTEDNLLSEGPNLYEFEKQCVFQHSKTRQPSFKLTSSDIPEPRLRSKSSSIQNSPLLKTQHNLGDSSQYMEESSMMSHNLPNITNERLISTDQSNPVFLEEIENLSNPTKEDDEEESYSEISSVIMEEEDEEEKTEEEALKGNEIDKENENNKSEQVNNDNDLEKQDKDENKDKDFETILEEGVQKEKELFKNTDNLTENDSKDQLELEMAMNYADQNSAGLFTSKKLRYSEKYQHVQMILYPDDYFKSCWDVVLVLILAYTCTVMPFRIAFLSSNDNTTDWVIVDWSTDSVFYGDIIVNFLSAYYDKEEELVNSRKAIAWNYLTGWFFLDFVGTFPIDEIVDVNNYGNLVRVSRLPRLYRLLKLTRLLRLLKLVKERNKIMKKMLEVFRISAGFERLFFSFLSVFLFCHLMSCFWYMVGDLNDSPDNWIMRFDFLDQPNFDCYIASIYYVVQTVVTVGYGDISSGNTLERTFSCFLMFIGVFLYSFTIGSLSSLLSNLDSKSAQLDTQLNTLIQLKSQYNLDEELYSRLKVGVKYGLTRYNFDKVEFLNNLPLNLRVELSVIMHRKLVEGIDFFEKKPARFIAFIGPYLKALKHGTDEYIYSDGEYADCMYFIKQGSVSLVLKDHHNFEYLKIEKGYYFGEVDLLFGDTRKTTVMSNGDVEILALNKKNFTRIFFHEFKEIGSEIFKNALKRKLRSMKIQKEALEYCSKEKIGSFAQRSSLLRKNKSNPTFLPQISLAKPDYNNSLKESEVFTASYKPFQKESFYMARHTKEITHQIDKHLNLNGQTSFLQRKKMEKALENKTSFNSMFNIHKVLSNDINDAHSPKDATSQENVKENSQNKESNKESGLKDNRMENKKNYDLIINNENIKNKKGSYYEKFASMLATPLIAKNYIPFDVDLENEKKMKDMDESIKKVDELQKKITRMDKNMEEILNVFKEMGVALS